MTNVVLAIIHDLLRISLSPTPNRHTLIEISCLKLHSKVKPVVGSVDSNGPPVRFAAWISKARSLSRPNRIDNCLPITSSIFLVAKLVIVRLAHGHASETPKMITTLAADTMSIHRWNPLRIRLPGVEILDSGARLEGALSFFEAIFFVAMQRGRIERHPVSSTPSSSSTVASSEPLSSHRSVVVVAGGAAADGDAQRGRAFPAGVTLRIVAQISGSRKRRLSHFG